MAPKHEDQRQIKIEIENVKEDEKKEDKQSKQNTISTFPDKKFQNDAGEEISVENGYSDADIRELQGFDEEEENEEPSL